MVKITKMIIISIIIAFFYEIAGFESNASELSVENDDVIYASEIKEMLESTGESNFGGYGVLVMDVSLELDNLNGISVVRGSEKLTINDDYSTNEYMVDEGANVTINGGLDIVNGLTIKKGGTLRIINKSKEFPDEDWWKYSSYAISLGGELNSYGDLYIDSDYEGIVCHLGGQGWKVNIFDGNFSIKSKGDCITSAATHTMIIKGGKVSLESNSTCIDMTSLYMSGGVLHTKNAFNSKDDFGKAIDCYNKFMMVGGELVAESNRPESLIEADEIKISDELYIKAPFFGRIRKIKYSGDFSDLFDDREKIVDADDNEITKVVITKKPTYHHDEWISGVWYDSDGNNSYAGIMSWKSDSYGWWIEDTTGWYPTSQWQKIDGYWYYFDSSGYMVTNEWRNNRWIDGNGVWTYEPLGVWGGNLNGHWYEDSSGWYACGCWQKINGDWYYFDRNGYLVTERYINGWWVDENGVCR